MKRPSSARISQYLFLALFLVLFVQTEYRGSDEIPVAVNSFFRADPLVGVSALLAAKGWSWLVFPGLLLLFLSLLLGRFFCGWICPLGTVLDLLSPRIAKTAPLRLLKGGLKYWLLGLLLASALAGSNLSGLLDPLAILLRGLTFALYPLLGESARQGWVGLFRLMGDSRDALAPAYGLLRDYLLPFRTTMYPLALGSLLLLAGVIGLERFERRNWCRNLCPLGTLLGLVGRFSLFRRVPLRVCADCSRCRELCPTSFDRDILQQEECILCLDCQLHCPNGRVRFRPVRPQRPADGFVPARRVFLGGIVSGLALGRLARFRAPDARTRLLRPPGVQDEDAFLEKCVRCGECLKVCLRSALYPAVGQAGLEGLYTPVLIPRLGYCEYNCTLCGQVCPTGAIPRLPREEKQRQVIGKAVFDKNHCLPLARAVDCMVCEEHCPIPGKAIRSRRVTEADPAGRMASFSKPYVVPELCNGCGICENVCPLEGKAGIEVFAVKDHTPITATAAAPDVPVSDDPYR